MPTKYSKDQLLDSKKFTGSEKDLLTVLLDNNKTYSLEECDKLLKKEQRREIK